MMNRRHHTNHLMTCSLSKFVVLGVSVNVAGWWWQEGLSMRQP